MCDLKNQQVWIDVRLEIMPTKRRMSIKTPTPAPMHLNSQHLQINKQLPQPRHRGLYQRPQTLTDVFLRVLIGWGLTTISEATGGGVAFLRLRGLGGWEPVALSGPRIEAEAGRHTPNGS